MQNIIFYVFCFGFIIGVLLRSFIFVNLYLVILFGIVAFAIILFHIFVSKNKWGIVTGIFILAFSLGVLRFQMADVPAPSVFESQVGQEVSFSGEIIDEPTITENNQKLILEIEINEKKQKF